MWIILGFLSIIFAICGFFTSIKDRKDKKSLLYSFISLSLTTLTIAFLYRMETIRLLANDIAGLMDIMPTMANIILIGVIFSIIVNFISLIRLIRSK